MIAHKEVFSGKVTWQIGNMVFVRRGDGIVDSYNTKYYRVVEG